MNEAETPRKSPVLKIRSKSRSVDEFVARYCMDFSRAGMFIKTKRPFEQGTTLRFEFQLLDGTVVFAGKGSVAWKREDKDDVVRAAGMGVAFDELQESAASLVERLVRSRGGRRSRFDDRGSTPPVAGAAAASPGVATGLLASIAEHPLDVGNSPPSPLATRLKSSPPSSRPPPLASGPPVAPDPWRAAEPEEEPTIEDPEDELGARLLNDSEADRDRESAAAMGQLQGVLAQAFEETVRRTSRPPSPDELNLAKIAPEIAAPTASLSSAPPEAIAHVAYKPAFEHGPYTGRATALSDPHRAERLHSLFDKAKFDEPPKNFRSLTWGLMGILFVLIAIGAVVRYAGPDTVTLWIGKFSDILRPALTKLGIVQ